MLSDQWKVGEFLFPLISVLEHYWLNIKVYLMYEGFKLKIYKTYYFPRHWTIRSFPSGLVTLDVMQYGKEESGEELAVSKDVWFNYTSSIHILNLSNCCFFILLGNKCFTVVLNAIMKGFHNSWATELITDNISTKHAYLNLVIF